MSYALIEESFPVARKRHTCIWCGENIDVGEKHRHEKSNYCGDFQNHRWHMECNQAAQVQFADEGDTEFSPYDNPRPEKISA
jgi:hypothetical protein